MHELLLARAALPAPTVIQRTSLRPYSLGHALCLVREGNAFMTGTPPTRKDILELVWICSNTWEENRRAHDEWLSAWKFKAIAKRFKKADIAPLIESIRSYLTGGCLEFPLSDIPRPVERHTKTARPPGAPFLLMLHHFLVTHYRLSVAEAWDFPFGEAKMRWCCHWEQEGGLDIANEQDAKFNDYIERREREKKEKGK